MNLAFCTAITAPPAEVMRSQNLLLRANGLLTLCGAQERLLSIGAASEQ